MAKEFCLYYFLNMQRLLICCCLLAATGRGMEASPQDDRDHEMVRISENNDDHHDHQPSAVDMRIVGGWQTTNSRLGGFIVAMFYHYSFICAGSLIRDNIVLTAAHCFSHRLRKQSWSILGGLSSLYSWWSEHRKIKDFIKHWKYRNGVFDWDVAVVRLNRPMAGWNIKTVSLCTTKLPVGVQVDVAGWGKTRDTAQWYENNLRAVRVPIIDWHKCQQAYSSTQVVLTSRMLCAGVLGSKDACTADSGGPLAYNKQVCGIVSFGIGCASKRYPGVYTDVYAVKPYIEQAMQVLLSRP